MQIVDYGAPIDVLWFKIPRSKTQGHFSLASMMQGKVMVFLNRTSYWQCAFVIKKGDFERIKSEGIQKFQQSIVALEPKLEKDIQSVNAFDNIKLLTVRVDHLKSWYKENILFIGDAAHAMSPVGGVGINLAIQDAVAAANVLIPAFTCSTGVNTSHLRTIQKRRERPTKWTQKAQTLLHTHVIQPVLQARKPLQIPLPLRWLQCFPLLQRIPGRMIGVGVRPEYISKKVLKYLQK